MDKSESDFTSLFTNWWLFSPAAIIAGRSAILFSYYPGSPLLSKPSDWVIGGERQFNGIQGRIGGSKVEEGVKCCHNPRLQVQPINKAQQLRRRRG